MFGDSSYPRGKFAKSVLSSSILRERKEQLCFSCMLPPSRSKQRGRPKSSLFLPSSSQANSIYAILREHEKSGNWFDFHLQSSAAEDSDQQHLV